MYVKMLTGSAEVTLHTFRQIINDLSLASRKKVVMLLWLKSRTPCQITTLSRRISILCWKTTKRTFCHLLYKTGTNCLHWNKSMSSLNNFFCGMHVLVEMADATLSILVQWELLILMPLLELLHLSLLLVSQKQGLCGWCRPHAKRCVVMATNKLLCTNHSLLF